MASRKPLDPTAILSNSSRALQTQKELDAAHHRIKALEQELTAQQQRLLEQIPAEQRSQAVIPIAAIQRRPYRSRKERDPQAFQALVESIQTYGFRGSIWLQQLPGGELRLIAGETRMDAALEAGLTEIPADIVSVDDITAAKLCRVENSRRKNLNELDDTEEILYLLSLILNRSREETISTLYQYKNTLEGNAALDPRIRQTIEAVFQENAPELSILTFITKRMRLLSLPPDVLEAYNAGELTYTKAIELAKVTDAEQRQTYLQHVIAQDLSVSEIKSLVKPLMNSSGGTPRAVLSQLTKMQTQIEKLNPKTLRRLSPQEQESVKQSILALEQLLQQKRQQLEQG